MRLWSVSEGYIRCPIQALARPTRTHAVEQISYCSININRRGPPERYINNIKRAIVRISPGGEERHGICGMHEDLARRDDGGDPSEGDLKREPGIARCSRFSQSNGIVLHAVSCTRTGWSSMTQGRVLSQALDPYPRANFTLPS